jgi:hypothetical protein
MLEWTAQYLPSIGMSPVSVVTTVFGAFAVSFVAIVCWRKLVEDFGPAGGMLAAGIIIGTFWVMNHKLPGFGIHPEGLPHPDGGNKQFGLIYQGFKGASPWVDMGTAIAAGFWFFGFLEAKKGQRIPLAIESLPRIAAAVVGGAIGGAIVGLVGWTGANLFGYR